MISDGEDEHPNYARCEWLIDGKFRKKQKKKKNIHYSDCIGKMYGFLADKTSVTWRE